MKKSELRTMIREQINILLPEMDDDNGLAKKATSTLGLKQERGVIEGDAVKNNVDVILALLKKYDSNHKMQFYPKTGKMVGAIAKSKIPILKKELVKIDKGIIIKIKPLIIPETADIDLKQLESLLSNHDWYYMYSDMNSKYQAGEKSIEKIKELIKKLISIGKRVEAKKLWQQYADIDNKTKFDAYGI